MDSLQLKLSLLFFVSSFVLCDSAPSCVNNGPPVYGWNPIPGSLPDNTYPISTLNKIDPFSGPAGTLRVAIEIPMGSSIKIQYREEYGFYDLDRYLNFIPYIFNYGFIPKTLVQGVSDNDPMDVIVISDMLPRGQVIDVIPIALLRLADYGHGREEVDDKVVAVPADKALQSISAQNFFEFSNRFPNIMKMIGLWYEGYKPGYIKVIGWEDDLTAWNRVSEWNTDKQAKYKIAAHLKDSPYTYYSNYHNYMNGKDSYHNTPMVDGSTYNKGWYRNPKPLFDNKQY